MFSHFIFLLVSPGGGMMHKWAYNFWSTTQANIMLKKKLKTKIEKKYITKSHVTTQNFNQNVKLCPEELTSAVTGDQPNPVELCPY